MECGGIDIIGLVDFHGILGTWFIFPKTHHPLFFGMPFFIFSII
jgi:hypothetical protein